MFYLCQKSANVINLLQFLYAYIIGPKSFNDFLCDDIGCFIQKRPFDKMNKITLTTHKST